MNNDNMPLQWRILLAIAIYSAGIIIWGVRQEGRINVLEIHHEELDKRLERIDDRGSRQLPILSDRISYLEARVNLIFQQNKSQPHQDAPP